MVIGTPPANCSHPQRQIDFFFLIKNGCNQLHLGKQQSSVRLGLLQKCTVMHS